MTYNEAKALLDSYNTLGSVYGLEGITRLLEKLNRPDRQLKIIHVAGTNGKGSTVTTLAAILDACGYQTATYTSPEVTTYLDRFRISGMPVSEDDFLIAFEKAESAASQIQVEGFPHPTVFEMELAIAYLIAIQQHVDVMIQETGLGGRLDATNVVEKPILTIFTAIGLDHTQFLGNTVEAIAAEKAGIIKNGTPVVSYDNGTVINAVIRETSEEYNNRYQFSNPEAVQIIQRNLSGQTLLYQGHRYHYPLIGTHQVQNFSLILTAVDMLRTLGWQLPIEKVQKALDNVKWPGRFEIVSKKPVIILDGAHNPQAAEALADSVRAWFPDQRIHLLVHIFKDKDAQGILRALAPIANHLTLTTTHNARSTELETLAVLAKHFFENATVQIEEDFNTALQNAQNHLSENDVLLICGSLSHLETARCLLKDTERI